MTLAELAAQAAAAGQLTPAVGDIAWTKYHGETHVGRLVVADGRREGVPSELQPFADEWHGPHRCTNGIFVGYDKDISWDAERNMWNAPADSD